MYEFITLSLLNGILYGMLIFMMASGLTLIFSLMGILNLAHASFYMIGAYLGYSISVRFGFLAALVVAPIGVGVLGAAVERFGLRQLRERGHVAELLFTFGLALVIEELVAMVWGRVPVDYRVPAAFDFVAFTIFGTTIPAYRLVMLVVSAVIFGLLLLIARKTRVGLIVQASLTHADMVQVLGHNVPWVFTSVFGVGTALAGLAGALAGPILVTQPAMAGLVGPIIFVVIVIGGLGSLTGAFIASIAVGLIQTFSAGLNVSLSQLTAGILPGQDNQIGAVTLGQIATVIPFLLLVLTLVVKPNGLMGQRER
ncbi:branched-chain amino acid ABC transporter permease [Bradyrhizobium sp. CW7]|uniref:branched-chain amino acid ABC transporter permease n=1 Tax=Bradyrhizobium sp. CW7 TaxID=2782688 RepID=UPI001FF7F1A6|nr:branched-chain amino acid ABC transporter permease [Bradyrhizobium sp. CW7]MCK1356248.1 branched-chain amino acid ABC transporter permease [Bradyrhizobium sp. CW7]